MLHKRAYFEQLTSDPRDPSHWHALFLQHDLNLYNFIINLNNTMAANGVTIRKVDDPDFSAITVDDSFPFAPFPERWSNFLDLSTAIEIFTPVYQFFLTDNDFWRAS